MTATGASAAGCVEAERIARDLAALAAIGAQEGGGISRLAYSEEDWRARARIMAAMKAHHIFPLHSASIDNLEQLIKAGIMVTHGTSIELTNKGRAFTKRQMPY